MPDTATLDKPKYILTDGMSREEWLRWRQKGIGGSDAGGVLGLSMYSTPYDIWEQKIALIPISIEENERMEWGKRLEAMVAQAWEEKTGWKIRVDNKIRFHPEIPYLLVNLDRTIVAMDARGPGVLEVKTAGEWSQKEWEQGIPYFYYAQVQHELLVTGYKWGELAVLFGGNCFRRFSFEWDQVFIDKALPVYADFWLNYVIPKIPPSAMTNSDLSRKYPEGDPTYQIIASAFILSKIEEAGYIKSLALDYKKQQDAIYVQLKDAMGQAERLISEDGVILATYTGKNGKRTFRLKGEESNG